MVLDNYRWHYNYVRLAWDSGFTFEKYKLPNADKNKICPVDIDRIIRERDVALVEHHISTVVEYVLDKEQAEVLDTNFVKIFRMGQLAVEYLLFCKKYLDNTVVLLKKDMAKLREEADELRLYTKELEAAMKQCLSTTFKCDKCPKMFSTQEFLTAHFKRRHNLERMATESDSLQSEVKRLKERLNETEKYLKEKSEKTEVYKPLPAYNDINEQVLEIQNKFENFKKMVESDIANIQAEKKGYEEKYSSLLDIVVQNVKKDSGSPSKENIHTTKECFDMTTQTETGRKLNAENTHNKNVYECTEAVKDSDGNEKIEEKINEIGTTIESKISIGFTSIEQQMYSLFERLQELENKQSEPVQYDDIPQSAQTIKVATPKPQVKPRSKLSQPTALSPTKPDHIQVQKLKDELELMLSARTNKNSNEMKETIIESIPEIHPNVSDQIETSEDSSGESVLTPEAPTLLTPKAPTSPKVTEIFKSPRFHNIQKVEAELVPTTIIKSTPVSSRSQSVYSRRKISEKLEDILKDTDESELDSDKKPISIPRKVSNKVVKKVTIKDVETEDESDPIQTHSKENVLKSLKSKLQDIGISMDWRGIPKETLHKALEMVTHQANLNKKTYPEFSTIRKNIEKSITKEIRSSTTIVNR